jgi:hypothetical protein
MGTGLDPGGRGNLIMIGGGRRGIAHWQGIRNCKHDWARTVTITDHDDSNAKLFSGSTTVTPGSTVTLRLSASFRLARALQRRRAPQLGPEPQAQAYGVPVHEKCQGQCQPERQRTDRGRTGTQSRSASVTVAGPGLGTRIPGPRPSHRD